MVLLQAPVALNLAGNLSKFKLSAAVAEVVTVQLKKGADIILEEKYIANSDGFIFIDFKDLIIGLLTLSIPDSSVAQFHQSAGYLALTAVFTSTAGGSGTTVNFTVVRGGVDAEAFDSSIFLAGNFLTWQPQTKEIKFNDPEFLTYYAQQQSVVKLKYFVGANAPVTVNLVNLAQNQLTSLNASYAFVSGIIGANPNYYDVWVEDMSGNRLSFIQRYVYSSEVFDFENIFVFENTLGGIDTLRLVGEITEKNLAEVASALFDEIVLEYDLTVEKSYSINSGFFKSERHRQWANEFINSIQKYHIYQGRLNVIYAKTPEAKSIPGELAYFELEFIYGKQTKYQNLLRNDNVLPNLEIATDIGEVFFLAPRLNELQWANTNDLLFPVQYAYEDFFRKVSLSYILAQVGEGGNGGISKETDPTVPLFVKQITQQDITNWNQSFSWGNPADYGFLTLSNATGLYQPIENQRLSTTDTVTFNKLKVSTTFKPPTVEPPASDLAAGEVVMWIGGFTESYTPPTGAFFMGLMDVDAGSAADGYELYWNAALGKVSFRVAQGGGGVSSWNDLTDKPTTLLGFGLQTEADGRYKNINYAPAWTEVTGRPTVLSQFTNDLGLGSFAYRNSINGIEVLTDKNNASLDIGVSRMIRWQAYGSQHVIFDASAGIAPNGATVDINAATNAWQSTFPTLMGWNGVQTYGVRVDRAGIADFAYSANETLQSITNRGYNTNTGLTTNNGGSTGAILSYDNDAAIVGSTAGPLKIWVNYAEVARFLTDGNLKLNGQLSAKKINTSGFGLDTPILGQGSNATAFFGGINGLYGLLFGVSSNGNCWLQSQRVDGFANAYDLVLQPAGGKTITPIMQVDTMLLIPTVEPANGTVPAGKVALYIGGFP